MDTVMVIILLESQPTVGFTRSVLFGSVAFGLLPNGSFLQFLVSRGSLKFQCAQSTHKNKLQLSSFFNHIRI